MTVDFPKPGKGYVIREYLGGGFWKRAFRASSANSTADVALLYPHDESRSDILLKDVHNLIRTARGHEFSSYLAQFYGFEYGEDGKLFIVEELLDRPLDKLHPLYDLSLFSRIARDLCKGLCCLHENRLVHRDLKLDNCGMDPLQRAKIFDLGSVTSEQGGVEGTIFTRAPELFARDGSPTLFSMDGEPGRVSYPADVWALGATLFALRIGVYPFVHDNEIRARRALNAKIAQRKIRENAAEKEKREIDRSIASRVMRKGAPQVLSKRVQDALRGRAGEILNSMLSGEPNKRLAAREYVQQWGELCNELGGAGPVTTGRSDKWIQIAQQLTAVKQREFSLSRKQLERLISEVKRAQGDDPNNPIFKQIDTLLRQVKVDINHGEKGSAKLLAALDSSK